MNPDRIAIGRPAKVLLVTLWAAVALHASAQGVVPPPPASPAPVVGLEYDALGSVTRQVLAPGTPGLGLATSHRYDPLGHRVETLDARGGTTRFAVSARGLPLQVTDPRGLWTSYQRTGLGEVVGLGSPDTGVSSLTVDAAGNVVTRTDSRGVVALHSVDALNRLRAITFSGLGEAPQVFGWMYDQTGAGFSHGLGRLTSTQFPAGTSMLAYDALGQVIRSTQVITSAAQPVVHAVGYAYDTAGHVVAITYPSGRVVTMPHTSNGPQALWLSAAGGPSLPLIADLRYQPQPGAVGSPASWAWQLDTGMLAHVRQFDDYGRMVRHPVGGAVRDLSYDAAGRTTRYTHHDTSNGSPVAALDQAFDYDESGQLVGIATSVASWAIRYDANGNRASVATTAARKTVVRDYSISATSNALLALDRPHRVFDFDVAGNVVGDKEGGRRLTHRIDLAGRIAETEAALDGSSRSSVGFEHNTQGQRVVKRIGGNQACGGSGVRCTTDPAAGSGVVYVYDEAGHLLGEYRLDDGSVIREYVWLQDMPVAVIDGTLSNPIIYYIQTDHLDTPRVMLDRAGRQRWSWMAEPFGHSAPVEDPLGIGPVTLNLRMPGQYYDRESGLTYNWHRTYDSGVGRFTQSDPIGLAGGINTYAYVEGNPVNMIDPTGEFGWVGAGVGAGLNFGGQMAMCMALGGDLATCLKCVDYLDVGLSAARGAMGVGLFQVANVWRNAARAEAAMTRLMGPVGSAVAQAQRRALTERFGREWAATAAAKWATPPWNFCDEDVCKKFKLMRVISGAF